MRVARPSSPPWPCQRGVFSDWHVLTYTKRLILSVGKTLPSLVSSPLLYPPLPPPSLYARCIIKL